jgi:hypothetical protein
LGAWTALGFFVALFTKSTVFGFESFDYFMSTVVLSLAAHGTKFCPCCRFPYVQRIDKTGMKGEAEM